MKSEIYSLGYSFKPNDCETISLGTGFKVAFRFVSAHENSTKLSRLISIRNKFKQTHVPQEIMCRWRLHAQHCLHKHLTLLGRTLFKHMHIAKHQKEGFETLNNLGQKITTALELA